MTDQKKQDIHQVFKVIILNGRLSDTSKCNSNNCKKADKYMVFSGTGTKLSDLFATCCEKHLHVIVDEALEARKTMIKNRIKSEEKQEIEAAKQLLLRS